MITESAGSERTKGVDTRALHNGHDLRHCYQHCRDLWYVGERESKEEEETKFKRMLDAFDQERMPLVNATIN
jgi:hypothetical protein